MSTYSANNLEFPTFKLRFVERDGKRILQFSTYCRTYCRLYGYSDPAWTVWADVPLEQDATQPEREGRGNG